MALNFRSILKIFGVLLCLEAALLTVPLLYALLSHDGEAGAFLVSIFILLSLAAPLWLLNRSHQKVQRRDIYLIVAGGWVLLSLLGMLPYIFGGAGLSMADAFFETVSGFTTTGASVIPDIESISPSLLLWRSLTQWVGGMGIIVLMVAVMPIFGIGGMQLFSAESPGVYIDKLRPRIKETALIMWVVYLSLTAMAFGALLVSGLSVFDAINHAMTTLATGGFSTKSASAAAFPPAAQYTLALFMFLAATNFALLYAGLKGNLRVFWKHEEFRFFVRCVLVAVSFVTAYLFFASESLEAAFRHSLFQVVSIVTTTGLVTDDYTLWHAPVVYLMFLLMFVGGMTGSTAGGIKVMRHAVLLKSAFLELKKQLYPDAVLPLRFNKVRVNDSILYKVLSFVMLYILIAVFASVVLMVSGISVTTSVGAVVTTLGNIGPGFGAVGPASTFVDLPSLAKVFLSFLMILGRLELFTVLILLTPYYWQRS